MRTYVCPEMDVIEFDVVNTQMGGGSGAPDDPVSGIDGPSAAQ